MAEGPTADQPPGAPQGRQRGSGLIDRRLTARVAATRRFLILATALGLVSCVLVVVQAVLLASVIERAMQQGATLAQLTPRLVALGAAFVARALLAWASEASAQRVALQVTGELRQALLRHTLDLGPRWLAGERAGELSLAATRGVAALDVYFGRYLPQALLAAVAPVVLLVWVAWADWLSALILVALVALVPVAMVAFGRRAAAENRRQWRRLSSLSARFLELIQGLATLRALNRADLGRREVAEATEGLRRTTMATLRVAFLSALALEMLAGLGTGLVAMVLGFRLLAGTVPLATALAVLLVSPEIFVPLRRAGAEFHAGAEGQAAAQRILDVLDQPTPAARSADHDVAVDLGRSPLVLEHVTLSVPGRADPVLDDLSLEVGPGEHVALVGPSGAGKSTVLALLLGFVAPDAGTLRVGDLDLGTVTPARWRRQVAWVPQRPYLFSGTLAQNLALGRPDADPEALEEAVAVTGLGHLVGGLPRGLETAVGEGGLTLSAGERQRVALARAWLCDAPLVLLDEPAAHLDAAAEDELAVTLAPWLAGRSVVVAAHRVELVGRVDRVVHLPGPPARPPTEDDRQLVGGS